MNSLIQPGRVALAGLIGLIGLSACETSTTYENRYARYYDACDQRAGLCYASCADYAEGASRTQCQNSCSVEVDQCFMNVSSRIAADDAYYSTYSPAPFYGRYGYYRPGYGYIYGPHPYPYSYRYSSPYPRGYDYGYGYGRGYDYGYGGRDRGKGYDYDRGGKDRGDDRDRGDGGQTPMPVPGGPSSPPNPRRLELDELPPIYRRQPVENRPIVNTPPPASSSSKSSSSKPAPRPAPAKPSPPPSKSNDNRDAPSRK